MPRPSPRLGWRLGVLTLCCVVALPGRGRAGDTATVEGRVALPARTTEGPAAFNGRYALGTGTAGAAAATAAAAPEPPVAVVYLEGRFPARANGGRRSAAVMGQQNARFTPGVLPIEVGTTVEFPNLDDFYHNVFSYSKPKRFDLGRYRRDERPATQTFDKPGVVTLHCEIHEAMRGTILVLETPHFVRTDAAGRYRLEGLPVGRYVLKAWLNEKTTLERPVELREEVVTHVDLP